jgi:hypothetical protein
VTGARVKAPIHKINGSLECNVAFIRITVFLEFVSERADWEVNQLDVKR